MTEIEQVTVAGGGVLGSQIAYQCAFKGKNVTVYDIGDDAVTAAKKRIKELRAAYKRDMKATDEQFDAGLERISFATDLGEAVRNADLVIEAIPEKPSIKHGFYRSLAKAAPEKTIFASNSSTYVPSTFAEDTGRPDKFLNMHFANQIWLMNTAEIMGTDQTDPSVYDQIISFARQIGMVPIQLHKEQPGYVLNTLLMPLMGAAGMLWAHDVADPYTIDKTWMIATGAPKGPFGFYDMVGLRTAYNILCQRQNDNPQARPLLDKLKAMIDQGKLGEETGQGFYHYPDPDYRDAEFLKS